MMIANTATRRVQTTKFFTSAQKCRNKFLRFFPKGFYDQKYLEWEREYKLQAHRQWNELLNKSVFRDLLKDGKFREIAARAVKIESRTNLLFSFEKMALRDALKKNVGARAFSEGLFYFLHGAGKIEQRFDLWCETLANLPRKQTRVLTWTTATVFGFIAQPETHIFLKPNTTRAAAGEYGFDFKYNSRPSWKVYANLLEFAEIIRRDLVDLKPRDMIDIQSFIWAIGSDEYAKM
jgi:hypothetical protein